MTSAQNLRSRPTTAPARFGTHLADVRRAQKSGAGVPAYTRWVNRRLARGVAAAAATAGLGPNAVTAISAVISASGLILLIVVPPSAAGGLIVAFLLAAGYVLDSADGQVARLTGRTGPAGEWLDHVVDSVRTPAVHLSCAVATYLHRDDQALLMAVALAFAVVSGGQFLSQILADQLSRSARPAPPDGNQTAQSVALIPTDTGTLCWSFVLWGAGSLFTTVYLALFLLCAAHAAVSMRRRYVQLRDLASRREQTTIATPEGGR